MAITTKTRRRIIQLLDEGKTYKQVQAICGVGATTVWKCSRLRRGYEYPSKGERPKSYNVKARWRDNDAQRKACLNCDSPTCSGSCERIRMLT